MISYIFQSFHEYFAQGIHVSPVFLVLLVGFMIQGTKVIIDIIKYKKIYWSTFFSSGGFPSFHTGLSSSVTMFVLLHYGIDSTLFMVVFSFSMLFAYDAMNLRFEAGQHASYINILRHELKDVLITSKKPPLKERIGHTPLEVFGGFLFGAILTFVLYYVMYIR